MSGPGLIRAADARRMPWKNGGGETVELLAHPAHAGLDAFDWRVSMATVASDGPFSMFPGIDRTLTILDGEGLELLVGDAGPVRLTPASDPYGFPADAPCRGRLLAGPVTDLNVMTRRGRFSHAVTGLRLDGPHRIGEGGGTTVALCVAGAIGVGKVVLGRYDAAVLTDGDPLDLVPRDACAAALVIVITAVCETA